MFLSELLRFLTEKNVSDNEKDLSTAEAWFDSKWWWVIVSGLLNYFSSASTNDSVIFLDSDKNKWIIFNVQVVFFEAAGNKSDQTCFNKSCHWQLFSWRKSHYLNFLPFHLASGHTRHTQLLGLFVLYLIKLGNAKQIKYPSLKDIDWVTEWILQARVSLGSLFSLHQDSCKHRQEENFFFILPLSGVTTFPFMNLPFLRFEQVVEISTTFFEEILFLMVLFSWLHLSVKAQVTSSFLNLPGFQ